MCSGLSSRTPSAPCRRLASAIAAITRGSRRGDPSGACTETIRPPARAARSGNDGPPEPMGRENEGRTTGEAGLGCAAPLSWPGAGRNPEARPADPPGLSKPGRHPAEGLAHSGARPVGPRRPADREVGGGCRHRCHDPGQEQWWSQQVTGTPQPPATPQEQGAANSGRRRDRGPAEPHPDLCGCEQDSAIGCEKNGAAGWTAERHRSPPHSAGVVERNGLATLRTGHDHRWTQRNRTARDGSGPPWHSHRQVRPAGSPRQGLLPEWVPSHGHS